MVVLSDLPQVRQLVSVTRMQSRTRAWVFTVPAQPVLRAFLLSLPIVTFLLLHWEELLTHLDTLQSHCSPGGAQEMRALLFFFLTALPLFFPPTPSPPALQCSPCYTAVIYLQVCLITCCDLWEGRIQVTFTLVFPEGSTVPGTQWT